MARILFGLLAVALLATGCNTKSTPGGATNPTAKGPMVGQADNTFTLDPPNLSTSIKQGETQTVDIGIKRGKNFDQDVTLKVDGLPKGVTIDGSPAIKAGDSAAKLMVKVADDAALGDHMIKVIGNPSKPGATAASEFKITVKEK